MLALDHQKVFTFDCVLKPILYWWGIYFIGTGLHRYVFLVYKQSGKITPDEKKLTNRSGEGRANVSKQEISLQFNNIIL